MDSSPAITVVFMGDSITEGQYVHPSLRWTEIVAAAIQSEIAGGKADFHFFFNRGVSGETTRQGLERFPHDVQNARPDIMTLQFGLNDCNCWDTDRGLPRVSALAYRANLLEMIERARHFGTREIILSTNHRTLRQRKLAGGRTLEEQRIKYNEIVREVADATAVTLCDIALGFENLTQEQLARLLLPAPDVLHLSEEGHKYYAELIIPHLASGVQGCLRALIRDR